MNASARHRGGAALLFCAGALLGGAAAAWVSAEAPAPAAPPPLTYDCDSPSARFAALEQVQPGPSYRISGRVAAGELRVDGRWLPVAAVAVESADETRRVMLEISAPKRPDGPLELALRIVDGEKNERRLLGEADLGETLAFDLKVARGNARARIGRFSGEAAMPIEGGATVSAGCTTGAFRFETLDLRDRPYRP